MWMLGSKAARTLWKPGSRFPNCLPPSRRAKGVGAKPDLGGLSPKAVRKSVPRSKTSSRLGEAPVSFLASNPTDQNRPDSTIPDGVGSTLRRARCLRSRDIATPSMTPPVIAAAEPTPSIDHS